MNLISFDDVLKNPTQYVADILNADFTDVTDGVNVFKNIQPKSDDEFAKYVELLYPNHKVKWNFVRKSPLNQEEPNFIHKDDMMGDVTCILYLSRYHPFHDGTTIYDKENNELCRVLSKFNRMIAFNSDALHSRNIFKNFGEGNNSRLIQVIFLEKNEY
jgi:hypothetical protein